MLSIFLNYYPLKKKGLITEPEAHCFDLIGWPVGRQALPVPIPVLGLQAC